MKPAIIFGTYLAPNAYMTHRHIARYIEEQIGHPVIFKIGESFEDFANGQVDMAFMCGLAYTQLACQGENPVEPLAAPILSGERYQNKPIYFSDVIVRRNSSYLTFDDLGGAVWAYNEKESHSGYNLVYYSLLKRGRTLDYFGEMIETGSHQSSLQMVLEGKADAAAIDSHMLGIALKDNRTLRARLRIISTLGPSTVPPVVVAKRLDDHLKQQIQQALLCMHHHLPAVKGLQEGLIERFVPIADKNYQGIREMLAVVQEHVVLEQNFEELVHCVA